jgi:hypothetical protein
MDAQLQKLLEEAEVKGVVNAAFTAADRREWSACAALYTPEVIVDYQSLSGQPAECLSPQQLINRWESALAGFASTQYMLTNHEVRFTDPNQAVCHCYGHAVHYLPKAPGGEEWGLVGTYQMELIRRKEGWKIRYLQYNHKYQYGNPALPKLAIERAQER